MSLTALTVSHHPVAFDRYFSESGRKQNNLRDDAVGTGGAFNP
jgi:hypothetical protein